LEPELVGRDWPRRVGLAHGREPNSIGPMSGGNALAVTLSLIAGLAGTVQIAVMGKLGDRIGVVPALAFAAVVAAGVGVVALLVTRRSLVGFAHAAHQPWWLWIGGLMGAFVVFTITFAGPRIGTTSTVAVFLVGQFAAAIVVDRYGLFGLDRIPVGWPRVLGISLVAVGAALTLKK
ncbi:MAG TPA: DMT family transporter, partial [Gaiellaceae bacterium]|nr:DMT family transporter [Gaiellaceae bacterium]